MSRTTGIARMMQRNTDKYTKISLAAGTQPPVRESLDLTLVTLNRLELEPAQAPPEPGPLP